MVMLRLTAEQYRKLPILANESTCFGRTYIVTGSNSGLGLETARHLVEFSASCVILAVRNLTAGENAKNEIEKSTGRKGVVQVSTLQQLKNEFLSINSHICIRYGISTWRPMSLFRVLPRKHQQI